MSLQLKNNAVIDSAETLLAEQASKPGCFISLHTSGWEFIPCVSLLEALWWLSRASARSICFLLCQCNSCSLPSGFGLASPSSLYVLLQNLIEGFFYEENIDFDFFKGFLSLDKNGRFAPLRSVSSCREDVLEQGAIFCTCRERRSAPLHFNRLLLSCSLSLWKALVKEIRCERSEASWSLPAKSDFR